MFDTTIAGSLPKPGWLAETQKLWPSWKSTGDELLQAKADATLLWIKVQEDAGLDIIGDGEQARQHFVHGFVEPVSGIDFAHKIAFGKTTYGGVAGHSGYGVGVLSDEDGLGSKSCKGEGSLDASMSSAYDDSLKISHVNLA